MLVPSAGNTRAGRPFRSKAPALTSSQPAFLPDATAPDTAWLFPGQGAQEIGMGQDFWRQSAAARQVFEAADQVLGYSLSQICFEGPEERLRDTEFAQPAILTASLAALAAAVECGVIPARPAFMAGHSLGEYSALVAAGALSLTEGLKLVGERARLMSAACQATPGTLAAVIGLDEDVVETLCQDADVDVCNMNLPNQSVIGGAPDRILAAIDLATERGARRALELNVGGAFHSRLMQPAATGLAAAVGSASISDPLVPVVANTSAIRLTNAALVRQELEDQVARPVRWHQSVTLMAANGVSTFVEFGPGRVLTGLVKRLSSAANLVNVGSFKDLDQS